MRSGLTRNLLGGRILFSGHEDEDEVGRNPVPKYDHGEKIAKQFNVSLNKMAMELFL